MVESALMQPQSVILGPQGNPGLFIVVEGIDGSGKTELVKNLAYTLSVMYHNEVFCDYEFTDGFVGRYIQKHDKTLTDFELQLLAIYDRLDHIIKLDGVFQRIYCEVPHASVVSDRGWMSTLAYAMAANDNDINSSEIQLLIKLSLMAATISMQPHVTILIDTPVDIALERIERRNGELGRYENRTILERAYVAYNELVDEMNLTSPESEYGELTRTFITVDGTNDRMGMVEEAIKKMRENGVFRDFMEGEEIPWTSTT